MHLYTHKFFFFSSRRRHTRCSRDWSSDVCSSDLAKGWMAELPPEIVKVAVVVDAGWDEAISLAALPFISALQLHGRETPDFCRKLAVERIRFAKAVPVTTPDSLRELPEVFTRTVVLDSARTGEFGGSGR